MKLLGILLLFHLARPIEYYFMTVGLEDGQSLQTKKYDPQWNGLKNDDPRYQIKEEEIKPRENRMRKQAEIAKHKPRGKGETAKKGNQQKKALNGRHGTVFNEGLKNPDPSTLVQMPKVVQEAFSTTPYSLLVAETVPYLTTDPYYFRTAMSSIIQKQFLEDLQNPKTPRTTTEFSQLIEKTVISKCAMREAMSLMKEKQLLENTKLFLPADALASASNTMIMAYIPEPELPIVTFHVRGADNGFVFRRLKVVGTNEMFYWPLSVDFSPETKFTKVFRVDRAALLETRANVVEKSLQENDLVMIANRGLTDALFMVPIVMAVNALARIDFVSGDDVFNRLLVLFEGVREMMKMRVNELRSYLVHKTPDTFVHDPKKDPYVPLAYEAIPNHCTASTDKKDIENSEKKLFTYDKLSDELVDFWYRGEPDCGDDYAEKVWLKEALSFKIHDFVAYNYTKMNPVHPLMRTLNKARAVPVDPDLSPVYPAGLLAQILAGISQRFLNEPTLAGLPIDNIRVRPKYSGNQVSGYTLSSEEESRKKFQTKDVTVVVAQLGMRDEEALPKGYLSKLLTGMTKTLGDISESSEAQLMKDLEELINKLKDPMLAVQTEERDDIKSGDQEEQTNKAARSLKAMGEARAELDKAVHSLSEGIRSSMIRVKHVQGRPEAERVELAEGLSMKKVFKFNLEDEPLSSKIEKN